MYKTTLLLFAFLSMQFMSSAQASFQIATQAGSFYPQPNRGALDEATWNLIPEYKGYKYLMIQFTVMPDEPTMNLLGQKSIGLMSYLPKNTYYVKVPAVYQAHRFEQIHANSVFALQPEHKVHANIKNMNVPPYAVEGNDFKLMISLYQGVVANDILASLRQHGATVLDVYNQQHITVKSAPSSILPLAALPYIQFIDFINAPLEKENILNKTDHRSNVLNSDYGAGRHFDGAGVRVALTDDGNIGPHIDYTGRTTQTAVASINNGDHGDHCAGIIMGAGNLDPIGRGMAPGCDLWVYEAISSNNYILDDSIYTAASTSIDIVSTSYSDGCNSGYNAGAESADRQMRMYNNVMRVFSAGNNGTSNCTYGAGAGWGNITGGIKSAKNLIAVANLTYADVIAPSSSRGPASDGRIKPDVSAVGTDVYSTIDPNDYDLKTGTSMSCPGVSGVFAQLYQAYRTLHGGQDPNTGLLKNILMNSCDDIGNPGPDFIHGYGRINGLRAVRMLENTFHSTDSVNTGVTKSITLNVPANTQRVKIMLNWVDREAAVAASIALVNDLDIVVTDPAANTFLPWVLNPAPNAATLNANAIRAADHLNNAEQVTIDNPLPGNYTIDVTGFAVAFGPQPYFITYEFIANNAIEMTYPLGGEGFVPGETETLRWDAIDNGVSFSLDYTTNNGTSWIPITTGIASNKNYHNWIVPAGVSGQCKVRVTRGIISSSSASTFSIMAVPLNLAVTRVCPDTITISWSAVSGASSYEVYMLGTKYMDSVGSTTATQYHFTGLDITTEHWFSVKTVQSSSNAISRRAFAVRQAPGLSNCILQQDAQSISSSSPGNMTLLDCTPMTNFPVTLTFKNNGTMPMTNTPVTYQVNSVSPVQEAYSGTIAPGVQTTHSFAVPLTGLATGINILKIWSELPGDQYLVNDTLRYTLIVENSTVAILPWIENFESNTICPSINACDNINCPLVNNMVNEQNLIMDQFDWKVNAGTTPSTATGPDTDHTLSNATGKYVYTEASYCFNKTALLLTPCFSFTTGMKPYLTFWYHLYGVNQGSLHVDAFVDGEWQMDIVSAVSGDQGNSWKKLSKDLSAYNGKTVFFRFRGITGSDSKSDMALDDIGIVDSSAAANSVLDLEASFRVYPNPAGQFIEISAMGAEHSFDQVMLYNALGAVIYDSKIKQNQTSMKLDVSSFANGIYSLVLKNQAHVVYRHKLIKQ